MVQPNLEPWQAMDWAAKEVILSKVNQRLHQRWEKGRQKYRSDELGFQGDPLTHALEEAYDLIIYLEYAIRERESAGSRQTLLDLDGSASCEWPETKHLPYNPAYMKYPGQPVKVSVLGEEPTYIQAPDDNCKA